MTAPDGTPAPARSEVDGLSEVERERLRLLAGRVDWETTFAVVERIVAAHVEAALAPVRALAEVTEEEADALDRHMADHMYHHSISNNINGMSCHVGCRTNALRQGVDQMLAARRAVLPPPPANDGGEDRG